MTHLVLVRHGQTDWNLQGRVQGSSDIPLNETGRRQAREAGRILAIERWDAIVASPLLRARQTADLIGERVGIDRIEIVDDLRERSFGEAEGLTGPEIEERFRAQGRRPEGRERRREVIERVHRALVGVAERHPDESVLVVSHGGVIGSLVRHATEWAWPEAGQVIENGSSHRFAFRDGKIGLVEFNGRPWRSAADPVPDADGAADAAIA